VNLLRAATLSVGDAEATAERYARWLDYRLCERGSVSADLAGSWGAPRVAGRRYVLVQAASAEPVYLRFVEGAPPAGLRPLTTYGWAAIELCVADTLKVHARLAGSPFAVIGPPRELDGLPTIFPMQVLGPDGEAVFLTEIRGDLPEYDLPRARTLVDRLFIAVLGCSNLQASAHWFAGALGIRTGRELEIIYTVLSDALGMPRDHRHRLATGVDGRDCFLELDQYPPVAGPLPSAPGDLPPGIALATLYHRDLQQVGAPWITPPRPQAGVLYGGERAGTVRAPDGTLVEVVQWPG
jgi:catechol 2,3-dioxygenase-like lactoylglutathione lyase family enzyme